MTMIMSEQISSAVKFEYIKHKFVGLHDNLKILLNCLHQMGTCPEAKVDGYQIMKLMTNFFLDEIEYHLHRDVTCEQVKDYFVVYSNFYTRSCNEINEELYQISPGHHFMW